VTRRAALAAAAGPIMVLTVALAGCGDGGAEPRVEPLRVVSGTGVATGFAVDGRRVVTVAHVLNGPVTVARERALVLRVDRRSDLALLSVPGLSAGRVSIADGMEHGPVRVLRIRDGRVSSSRARLRREIVAHVRAPGAARAVRRPALELAASVTPGDSGAPVLTRSGQLLGVVFAASRGRAETTYAVDASALTPLLRP